MLTQPASGKRVLNVQDTLTVWSTAHGQLGFKTACFLTLARAAYQVHLKQVILLSTLFDVRRAYGGGRVRQRSRPLAKSLVHVV